jgi:hypothetical protein
MRQKIGRCNCQAEDVPGGGERGNRVNDLCTSVDQGCEMIGVPLGAFSVAFRLMVGSALDHVPCRCD